MLPGQPTYEQQWQKITSAYLNDELLPFKNCACFIGNLLNHNPLWRSCRFFKEGGRSVLFTDNNYEAEIIHRESVGLYTCADIVNLENNFLGVLSDCAGCNVPSFSHPKYEDALHEAMVSTLELLRQIHLKHNDETAIEIPLKKRELCTSST